MSNASGSIGSRSLEGFPGERSNLYLLFVRCYLIQTARDQLIIS